MLIHDFSDLHQALYKFAIDQFTYQGFLEIDNRTNSLHEAANVNYLRTEALAKDPYVYWAWWLRFSVAFENLLKAVFLRHQISLLKKRNIAQKAPGGSHALSTTAASQVYKGVIDIGIQAETNPWLASEIARLDIQHPWELNLGTLGAYRRQLSCLTAKSVMTPLEEEQISNAITVLSDIRRNVDAHVFLKAQTAGNINGDLTAVYLPACNLLLRAFQ